MSLEDLKTRAFENTETLREYEILGYLDLIRNVDLVRIESMKGTVGQFGTHRECIAYNQAIQDVIDMLERGV